MQNKLLDLPSKFFVGANYWASHAGTAMWRDWSPQQVELDLQRLAAAGIEVVRVFPLWPDFQPIHRLYTAEGAAAGYRLGEQRLGDDECGRAGMSAQMMERFREFTLIAQRCGVKIIVGLITGWMSGRLFAPPALEGKRLLSDPDAIRWQVRFVSYFVNHMKDSPAIIAWDLGNECNVMEKVESQQHAYVWTASVANAIKAADSTRPLLSGMHSLQPQGAWTMQDQGELTDILTTHPYPFWTPYLDYDPLASIRPTVHATVESLFYADIGGKPCFAEEMGTMGPMVCSEEVAAAFARTSMFSQWAHGLHGLLWWCASDQTHLQHAPYDWTACEGELGLMTEDGRVKPALQEMGRLKKLIQELPFAELPPRQVDAVCILNSVQDHWAAALGAFMLSKQAGFDISFRYEEQALPDAQFYILPCVSGVTGVGKQKWEQLLAKVRDGATLYLSSNDGYMLNFAELTGLTVQNRQRRESPASASVPGAATSLSLPLTGQFRLDYRNDRAEVLSREADGNPVLTRAVYGKGVVYYCALPLELTVTQQPGYSHQPERYPYWRFYRAISEELRADRAVGLDDPHVGVTEHAVNEDERIAVLVNYSPLPRELDLELGAGWKVDQYLHGSEGVLPPNDAAIVRLKRAAA